LKSRGIALPAILPPHLKSRFPFGKLKFLHNFLTAILLIYKLLAVGLHVIVLYFGSCRSWFGKDSSPFPARKVPEVHLTFSRRCSVSSNPFYWGGKQSSAEEPRQHIACCSSPSPSSKPKRFAIRQEIGPSPFHRAIKVIISHSPSLMPSAVVVLFTFLFLSASVCNTSGVITLNYFYYFLHLRENEIRLRRLITQAEIEVSFMSSGGERFRCLQTARSPQIAIITMLISFYTDVVEHGPRSGFCDCEEAEAAAKASETLESYEDRKVE
jgi:hypothetical protein